MKLPTIRILLAALVALMTFSCEKVNVTAVEVAVVAVLPQALDLPPGQSQQLTVQITDADGNTLSGRNVSWTSDDPGVATVNAAGNVTAVNPGSAVIRATAEGVFGNATVTVDRTGEITLSAGSVDLQVQQGVGAEPVQIEIANGGTGTLDGIEFTVEYGAGASGWLSASLDRDSAPATLTLATVGEVIDGLEPGLYTAIVRLTAPNAANGPLEIAVELTVSPPEPAIRVSPAARTFAITEGDNSAPTQTVTVTNIGGQELIGLTSRVVYNQNVTGWLNASLSSSSAPATITMSLNSVVAGLAVGVYSATVEVASAVAINSPVPVLVTLTVGEPPPSIFLSDRSLGFLAVEGEDSPPAGTVLVTNSGGGVLDSLFYTVRWDVGSPGWMAASLSSQKSPSTLTVTPDISGLTAGLYRATVSVASPLAVNSPQEMVATLTVQTPALIVLAPDNVSFTAAQNGSSPSPQSVSITNGGEAALTDLTATVVSYGGGQDGWLAATLTGGTTAPTTLQLTPTLGSRTPATLTAKVEVASPEAANGADTVDVTFEIVLSKPFDPTNLIQNGVSTTSITVRFADNANNEDGFVLERRTGGGAWTLVQNLPANGGTGNVSFTDTGLQAGQLYDYRVHAFNGAGNSNTITTTGMSTEPLAPTITAVDTVNATTVDVEWTSNNGNGVTFIIQRSPNGSSGWTTLGSQASNDTDYRHSSAADGTAHYYRVVADRIGGPQTATSNVASAVTRIRTPFGLGQSGATSSSVTLSWSHTTSSSAPMTFDIEQNGSVVASGVSGNSTTIGGLSPATTYSFRVRATSPGIPTSDWSSSASATTNDVPPAAPSGVTATVLGVSSVRIDWNDNSSNETDFQVRRNGSVVATVGAGTETFTDGGLTDGTAYAYEVRARNGAGNSAWVAASPASVTTNLRAPTGLAGSSNTAGSQIDLSWTDASGGEDGYEIRRAVAPGAPTFLTSLGANQTAYSDGGVTPGTTYNYQVCVTDPVAATVCSSTVTVTATGVDLEVTSLTVDQAAPTAPVAVTFTITVRNNGPSAATGVSVALTRTAGITLNSATGDGSWSDGDSPTWTIGGLASGATATINVEYQIDVAGTYTLTATGLSVTETDVASGNDNVPVGATTIVS